MDITSFYSTMAQLSFTLLGLWWVVVQFKYAEWMRNRRHRHMAYDVSLLFLLPGVMSLLAMVDPSQQWLWRTSFIVAALIGAGETALLSRSLRGEAVSAQVIHVATTVGYLLVALLAIVPSLPSHLNLALDALHVEAVLLSLLVFLGVNSTWVRFAGIAAGSSAGRDEPPPSVPSSQPPPAVP